jgi:predicted RNase H-like nuclease (RuvC/YqgF family)
MRRYWYLLVLAAVGLFATVGARAQQDQSQAKKPAHVITDDDIKHSDDSAAQGQASSSDADKDKDKDKQDQTAAADPADKRTEAQKAEEELKKWQKEKTDLQRKLDRIQEQEANETSEFRKQMFRDAYNNQQITLREYDQKIDTAQKNLDQAKAKEQEQGGSEAQGEQPPQGSQEQPKQDESQQTPPQ